MGTMPTGGLPAMSRWTTDERNRLDFYRLLVVRGRLTDGESEADLLRERKLTHRFFAYPRLWTHAIVAAHEERRR